MACRLLLVCLCCFVPLFTDATVSVDLQRDRLSPGYRARLMHAGKLFLTFCTNSKHCPNTVLADPQAANSALIDFIQFTFDSRRPIWVAVHAVLALQTANRLLKGALRPAWDSIQSWKLSVPVRSRTLMPIEIIRGRVWTTRGFGKDILEAWKGYPRLEDRRM